MIKVVHLVDDMSLGGVTRMVSHLAEAPALAAQTRQEVRPVSRDAWRAPMLEADVIVSHITPGWRALPFLTALRACHPGVCIVHVEHSYSEGFAQENVPAPGRFQAMLRASYAMADRVVAVSRAQADWLSRAGAAPARKLRVIAPSVDLAPFLAVAPRPSDAPARRIGLIGRLARQKGFDTAVQAFQRIAPRYGDASLHIFGAGPEEPALRRMAHGAPQILFHGETRNPAAAIGACDLVALPSRWEPFGVVALEARAASRPTLCAAVDGLNDHIEDGAVRVSAAGDSAVDAWAEAFSAALARPPAPADLMRTRSRAKATAARFVEDWRGLFEASLSPSPAWGDAQFDAA
ncbi:MAG: glycosyltransferase [Pseudomonadota bacterium]